MAQTHDHAGLEVEVENTGPCAATVRFTVTAAEFEKTRNQGLKNVAGQTRMKGFRPGKTPRKVVEKQFGEQVEREAIQHFLNHALDKAVKENDLRLASRPRVSIEDIKRGEDGGLTESIEVLLRPEFELGEYKGMKATRESLSVEPDEVEKAIEELRLHQSRPEPVDEDGLPADGMAMCRVEFLAEGEDEAFADHTGVRLGPQACPTGVDPEAFEKELTGANVDDTREFDIEFPDQFPEEKYRGQKGRCRVTVNEAYKIIKPTDDELFKMFEAEDLEAFEKEVSKRILDSKEQGETQRIENELLENLIEAHPMELPEPMLADQAAAKVEELRQSLEQQGVDPAEVEERLAQEKDQAYELSSRAMRAVYLMEEIAKREEIQVAPEDLQGEMAQIAQRNGVSIEEVGKYYQDQGLFQQLALELLERKVRGFLRESADIQESGSN